MAYGLDHKVFACLYVACRRSLLAFVRLLVFTCWHCGLSLCIRERTLAEGECWMIVRLPQDFIHYSVPTLFNTLCIILTQLSSLTCP